MSTEAKNALYTHLPIGEDVEAFAGYYTPEKEVRLKFADREVLYVTGHIVIETTCVQGTCSPANYWYASVPGYIKQWQFKQNKARFPITEVEPIVDVDTCAAIREIILKHETVARVDF